MFKSNQIHRIYIKCTLNNIIFTIAKPNGDALYTYSMGYLKPLLVYKRTMKFSTKACVDKILKKCQRLKIKKFQLFVKGVNRARYALIKSLKRKRLPGRVLVENVARPFNGCRPKKQRRL